MKNKIKLPKIYKRKSETDIQLSKDNKVTFHNILDNDIIKKNSNEQTIFSPKNLKSSVTIMESEDLQNEEQKLLITQNGKKFTYDPMKLEFLAAKLFKINKNKKKSLLKTPSKQISRKVEDLCSGNILNDPSKADQGFRSPEKHNENLNDADMEGSSEEIRIQKTIQNHQKLKASNNLQNLQRRITKGISKKPRIKENNIKIEDLKDELGGYTYCRDPMEKTYQYTIINSMCSVIIEKLNYLFLVFDSKMVN